MVTRAEPLRIIVLTFKVCGRWRAQQIVQSRTGLAAFAQNVVHVRQLALVALASGCRNCISVVDVNVVAVNIFVDVAVDADAVVSLSVSVLVSVSVRLAQHV